MPLGRREATVRAENGQSMTRFALAALLAASAVALAVPRPARAAAVAYDFAALPGPVDNCTWFDAHLNDRSEAALAQLASLLYNRAALQAPTPIEVTQTGTSAQGAAIAAFRYRGRILCAQSAAITPAPPAGAPPAP